MGQKEATRNWTIGFGSFPFSPYFGGYLMFDPQRAKALSPDFGGSQALVMDWAEKRSWMKDRVGRQSGARAFPESWHTGLFLETGGPLLGGFYRATQRNQPPEASPIWRTTRDICFEVCPADCLGHGVWAVGRNRPVVICKCDVAVFWVCAPPILVYFRGGSGCSLLGYGLLTHGHVGKS